MKKIKELGEFLFAQGWGFLVPYFLIYPFFWLINFKIQTAQGIFVALHLINLTIFFYFLPTLLKNNRGWGWLFWGFLFFFFFIPGAYLEYPADPWEHFRRLYSWQSFTFFKDNVQADYKKGSYFWGWTFLFWVKPLFRRWALDCYSAFWQWLLALQVYFFARRLGFSRGWAYLQVMAYIFFFGNNLFGIRYYALSSLPLAHIAYLRSLMVIMDVLDGRRIQALALLVLLPLIFFNHVQEAIFLLLGGILLILVFWYEKKSPTTRRLINFLGLLTLIGSLGVWILHFFPQYVKKIEFLHLQRVWQYNRNLLEALGIHGVISVLLSLLLLNRFRQVSLLTLAPAFLLIFPPTVYLIAHFMVEPYHAYRILYAVPTGFILVASFKVGIEWLGQKLACISKQGVQYGITLALLLVLAIPFSYPWRGRLFFQLYSPPPQNSLSAIDQTAQWFSNHRKFRDKQILLTDDLTDFVLSTHLGWTAERPYWYHRLFPNRRIFSLNSQDDILKEITTRPNVLGVLVGMKEKIKSAPPSFIGKESGHWNPNLGRLQEFIPERFEKAAEQLVQSGWIRTFVPPYYFLYEPPFPNR